MIIAVDFDGTIVTHEYPHIGSSIPLAVTTLRDIVENEHKLILNTMRSGVELERAVQYLTIRGVELWGVNCNPEQKDWTTSPKSCAHLYIDDAALGCPLIVPDIGRPYVDWAKVREYLIHNHII